MAPRTYGSTSTKDDASDASGESVELLAPSKERTTEFIGDVDASPAPPPVVKPSKWTKHHCVSYTLAALICLYSAHYWHNRADSIDETVPPGVEDVNGGRVGRVPMPRALSTLDPRSDLGFRSTTREGLASPSLAWGEHYYLNNDDVDVEVGGAGFTPLPTNAWYNNLLSHKAAQNPSTVGEVGQVYTVPYILRISPPDVPQFSSKQYDKMSVVAGIQLFLPMLKAEATNLQMVFNKNNGMSLGAVVPDDDKSSEETTSLTSYVVDPDVPISPLGVSLKWNHVNMKTSIVRGMPYGTVQFGKDAKTQKYALPTFASGNRPVSIKMDSHINEIGAENKILCGSFTGKHVAQHIEYLAPLTYDGKPQTHTVQRELIFHMSDSDFTWVAFFSKPVKVQCFSETMPMISLPGAMKELKFVLNVVEVLDDEEQSKEKNVDDELVVRMALLNECTTGKAAVQEHCEDLKELGYDTISSKKKIGTYLNVLRKGVGLFPKSPLVGTEFPEDDGDVSEEGKERASNVVFDWDATSIDSKDASPHVISEKGVVAAPSLRATGKGALDDEKDESFIMFALPHHVETLSLKNEDPPLCLNTFHGRTCLVHGSKWNMKIEHGAPQSFLADRPPNASVIPALADALGQDMKFEVDGNVLRGAGDTYFPAKIIAKMARVIEINEELQNLQSSEEIFNYLDADDATIEESSSAAAGVTLPSKEEVESLLDDLQTAVEIMVKPGGKEKGGAEAEFLYDSSWGGFVNCGCQYEFKKEDEHNGTCGNEFPKCPGLEDVNANFGNGWYNDHHFHYGYYIYAAAVVAKHRPEWAKEYYESILLYIRDIANPSSEDTYFPMFRQKDWYLGNSWAAGLMSMELSPHGREQESSSEAIAAFEGIALFGDAMMKAFSDEDEEKIGSARLVRNVGEFLTAMEVSAAGRFWHVWDSKTDEDVDSTAVSVRNSERPPHTNTYSKLYTKPVIGMMHETMASFQTWFAPEDVVSYGIQLIPFTAVAERRDDPEWTNILYPVYAKSCEVANQDNDGFCEDNGWSVAQACLLAEASGDFEDAVEMTMDIPEEVFNSDGGSGNSLSNTLWFISTRKQNPYSTTK